MGRSRAAGRPRRTSAIRANISICRTSRSSPFGHGLSYTRFTYGDLTVSPSEVRAGEKIIVEATVTNDGELVGEETALLFIRDPVASVSRPVLELRGVVKLILDPGQSKRARFTLTTDDLSYPDADFMPKLEAGVFEIFVGPSAKHDTLLKMQIHLAD
ncbi:fibronectin type III-like domain-contianing protein [Nordella sp. HKS 07]|uniref:fibronectin type III-like domain-contianing protein n=1 Tax=Nordella sp. HKS 07 TaxID=2712222 RepID=UPI001FF07416|nr:fibronectin type III-like domain-contianing protein [Nordella sp. HKS 07]